MKIQSFVNPRDFSCNVFVCSDERGCFVVDMGFYDSELAQVLKSMPKIDFVLQTHGHFDHILGLNDFCRDFGDVPVYFFRDEIGAALDPQMNSSVYGCGFAYVPQMKLLPLDEGTARIGGFEFEVIHTPGHTGGSCIFVFEKEGVVFTGDTIIETSVGRTDLPGGSEAALFCSLEKISGHEFAPQTEFYFGHGESMKKEELFKYNPFLRK